MKLTWDDIARIQTELDQSYVRALKAYEKAIESGAPAWLLAKPERIIFVDTPRGRAFKRNTAGTRKA